MLQLFIITLLVGAQRGNALRAEADANDTPALYDDSRLSLVVWSSGSVASVSFAASSVDVQSAAARIAGLPGPTHLRLLKDEIDSLGKRHVRFQQVQPFQGGQADVVGGDFIVHLDPASNSVYAVTGTSVQGLNVELPPKVTRVAAAATAGKEAQRRLPPQAQAAVSWQSVFSRDMQLKVVPRSDGDLVVWCADADHTDSAKPGVKRICVNGNGAGEVKESRNVLHTVAATGTGRSLYSGTVTIGTDRTSTSFSLRDPTRANMYTTNLNSRTGGGSVFTDADNVWGSGSTADAVSAGVDAHFGAAMTYDYFLKMHGRSGIDGYNKQTYSRVHYGRSYNNAFWSDGCFCMTYGDGDGVVLSPLVSLDVAGHEMTHGITSRTANLVYSGESGGLNEAMSDIFGTLVECYANSTVDTCDYLIGEVIYTPGTAGDALRYMDNPPKDGKSPACYNLTIGTLDVHYSSGPFNHFFWLLAAGGTSACSLTPISVPAPSVAADVGRMVAGRIVYRALTTYMTSSTKYAGAKSATLTAASDLYGNLSEEYNRTVLAWSGINMP